MASIETSGSGRKTNLEVNLVPFIDLMSVLITFLLITAVWSQVSMIQIGSSVYGRKMESSKPAKPPPDADVVLKLDVRVQGYTLTIGTQVIQLPLIEGNYDDAGLLAQLEKAKQLYPNKIDASLSGSDEVAYERMIRGMDYILKAGFSDIALLTGGPN